MTIANATLKEPAEHVLPRLRDDIYLHYAGPDFSGQPLWMIVDPLANKFYHIDWKTHIILDNWQTIVPSQLCHQINARSVTSVKPEDISNVVTFLSKHCLITQDYQTLHTLFKTSQAKHKKTLFSWLLKNYLFFKVPLIKPNALLDRTYPVLRGLFSKTFFMLALILGCFAILLISQRWGTFTNTFIDMFNIKYLLVFGVGMAISKSAHELGHALACKKNGLAVPTMGVAFLVMFPMLYTDTGQSWQVRSPKKRIQIALAGLWMELYVAIAAIWIWLITAPGVINTVSFFLATYSLLASLILNASPFLRFDGYHILSDILGMRNLQTRSFDLAKWWLREKLFGFGQPAPESFTPPKQALLLTYAYTTWIYRFFVFLGIALLVYHMFFKALGIILFIIEMAVFIFLPIAKELKIWWQMRSTMHLNTSLIRTALIAVTIGMIFFVPWQTRTSIPATLTFEHEDIYSPAFDAKLKSVTLTHQGPVAAGEAIITLQSPKLHFMLSKQAQTIKQLQSKLRDLATFQGYSEQRLIIMSELSRALQKKQSIVDNISQLSLTATRHGHAVNLAAILSTPNAWIAPKTKLATLVNFENPRVFGFVAENLLDKINPHGEALFIPDDLDVASFDLKLTAISQKPLKQLNLTSSTKLEYYDQAPNADFAEIHASEYGANIATKKSPEGNIIPLQSVYLATFERPNLPTQPLHPLRGKIIIDRKESTSLATQVYETLARFLIKESTF